MSRFRRRLLAPFRLLRASLERRVATRSGWLARASTFVDVPRDRVPRWFFLGALVVILGLGSALRAHWFLAGLDPVFTWHDQPILTSSDGFYFAAGVEHLLSDAWGSFPRVPHPEQHALVALSYALVKVLGIAPCALYTWLPVIVGPFIALPLAWLGRSFGRSTLGLVAALIAVAAPAYAIRTMVGYFDTDLFAVTVPLIAGLFLVRTLRVGDPLSEPAGETPERMRQARSRDLLLGAVWLATYVFFYTEGGAIAQSMGLAVAIGLGLVAFAAHLARRHEASAPDAFVAPHERFPAAPDAVRHAVTLATACLPIVWFVRVLLVVVAHLGMARLGLERVPRVLLVWLVMSGVVLVASSATFVLIKKVSIYAAPDTASAATSGSEPAPMRGARTPARRLTAHANDWKAQDTTGLVAEARVLPLSEMTDKAIGGSWLFALGLLGFVALLVARPSLFVLLPVLAVGLFAFYGGHRFLIYLTPFLALGLAWFAARLAAFLPRLFRPVALPLFGIALATPVVARTLDFQLPTALIRPEIEALEALDAVAATGDTTISWWDFGYPIVYFSHTRAITDGSRRGDDAALAAEILLSDSPALATNLARLAAQALGRGDLPWGPAIALFDPPKFREEGPRDFLTQVHTGQQRPAPGGGEVFLYLPLRLLPMMPALELFRPSAPGQLRKPPFMRLHRGVQSVGSKLNLGDGVEVDADSVAMWRTGPNGERLRKPLHEIHVVTGAGPDFRKRSRPGDPRAKTAGVYLQDVGIFVEIEPRLLASQWAQLFFFENADPAFYEPVYASQSAKVFRLKAPTPAAPPP